VVVGAPGATEVVAIDPLQPRVIARRRVGAALMRVAATPGELVLLLAPGSTIGPATLATVDGNGDVETVRLRIAAGLLPTEGVPFILRTRRPGLAVDARGRRAYVLTARPDVVEVDLAERRVQHHRITPARSLLDRLHDLVEPRAEAQQAVGPVRVADWIAPGTIAVAGQDAHVSWQPGGAIRRVTRPAGLQVIDTERWQTHTLDEGASGFRTARGLLLTDGDGLTAYQPDGGRAFHVLDDRRVELVATSGTLAYVREAARLHVVDLELGRVIGAGRPPDLLLDQTPAHGAG
jgi:hypothetical protein